MAKMKIGDFLFERKGRYKPTDKAIQGLKRIEKIDFNGNFHIGEKSSKTNMILVKKGDLVISGINVSKGSIGIYQGDEDVVATIHYSSYTFDKSIIDVEYFKRFMKSAEFIKLLNEQVKGGIKTEIKPKHLLPLEINLPDIKTQKKIVKKFESVETDIENLNSEVQTQQTLLKKLRQSILQEAIEGKLTASWREQNPDVESTSVLLEKIKQEKEQLIKSKKIKKQKPLPPINEDEIPFEIPDSWEWCRLGQIGYTLRGKSPKYDKNSNIFAINQKCVRWNYIDLSHCKNINEDWYKSLDSFVLTKAKDILVNSTGEGTIGRAAIVNKEQSYIYDSHVLLFRSLSCKSSYIMSCINSTFGQEQIDNAKGAKSTKQTELGVEKLNSLFIPIPPLEEQKEIVKKIENVFAICDKLEKQIEASKKSSQTLMQAVLKEAFEEL